MYEVVMTDRAYEWFASRLDLIRTNMKRYPTNYDLEFIQTVDELEGAILSAKKSRDPKIKPEAEKPAPPSEPLKPAKAPKSPPVPRGNNCEAHPTYGAKRRPRTDCEGCWGLYKKMHPLEYDKARRDFDRKQA